MKMLDARALFLVPRVCLVFVGASVLLGQQTLESGKPVQFVWTSSCSGTACVSYVQAPSFKIEVPDGPTQLEISLREIDKQPPGANATTGLAVSFGTYPDFVSSSFDFTVTPTSKTVLVRDGSSHGLRSGTYYLQKVLSMTGFVAGVSITDEVTMTLTAPNTPITIATSGVVNGASFQPGIAPNSWVTILGTNLSSVTDTWDKSIVNGKLPTTLGGATVSIGGKPAYLSYVSPWQINALAPDIGTGTVSVTVTNSGGGSATATAISQSLSPALFLWAGKYAVATHQDFSLAVKNGTIQGVATTPAKPGELIILWGTGFGPTNPTAPVGVQIPADNIYAAASPVSVTVGGTPAQVYSTALAPGMAGLYQVAFQIPSSAPDGDLAVVAAVNGVQSPSSALISVRGQSQQGVPLISNWRNGGIPAGGMMSFCTGGTCYYIYPWDFDFEDSDGDITYVRGAPQGNARLRIQLISSAKSCTIFDGPDASLNHAGEKKGTINFSTYLPIKPGDYGYSYSVILFDAAGNGSNTLSGPVLAACP